MHITHSFRVWVSVRAVGEPIYIYARVYLSSWLMTTETMLSFSFVIGIRKNHRTYSRLHSAEELCMTYNPRSVSATTI